MSPRGSAPAPSLAVPVLLAVPLPLPRPAAVLAMSNWSWASGVVPPGRECCALSPHPSPLVASLPVLLLPWLRALGVGQIVGTVGYAAPEYVLTGHLTTKSDIWAFGVVLLELLSGRLAMDKRR